MTTDPNPNSMIPADKTWAHSPKADRDEASVYKLPRTEVLAFLINDTDFMHKSSSAANDGYRRTINKEQYPHLKDPHEPLTSNPNWSSADTKHKVGEFVEAYSREHLQNRLVKVGFTEVLADHVYSDGELKFPHAIMLGLPMRYEETNAAPKAKAGEEVTRNYMELGGLTLALGAWLREHGYLAQVHHPRGNSDMNCEALFIPHAIAAGFGELGRHGSMISREFGPRIRLAMITTDAPIPIEDINDNAVDEFCTWCTKCLVACPVDAIPFERITLRGSERYIVDTTACLPYFAETDGCGICIAVCPYNKPDEKRSSKFVDQVQSLDWVKEANVIKRTEGLKAMQQYVAVQKAARKSTPD